MTTLSTIHDHIAASRMAGTLAAVEHIADELAALMHVDPDRVLSILHRDRDESKEIARKRRHLDYEVWAERLDERTCEALDALPNIIAEEIEA